MGVSGSIVGHYGLGKYIHWREIEAYDDPHEEYEENPSVA